MPLAIERNKSFVNIVGTVDLAARSGELLYVNPANLGTVLPMTSNDRGVELVVLGDSGEELLRFAPALRFNACEPGQAPTVALIQEDVRQVIGMAHVLLLIDGAEVARFDAPSAGAPAIMAVDLGPPEPGAPNRRRLATTGAHGSTAKYNVMVRAEGTTAWQAIAVGVPSPNVEVDANQFPGASRLRVRVVRSDGFRQTIIGERDVLLGLDKASAGAGLVPPDAAVSAARYRPPAAIDDFGRATAIAPDSLRAKWDTWVRQRLSEIQSSNRRSPLFYDHLSDAPAIPDSAPVPVPWNGFPRRLDRWYGVTPAASGARELANAAAEVLLEDQSGPYRVQDEYLEWYVDRSGSAIKRITFTCEPPEYWSFMAEHDPALVVRLYNELLHRTDITWESLSDSNGVYNPRNQWNTQRGAVHLTHWANSLGAEMQLASDATLGFPTALKNAQATAEEMMGCAGVGGINRSSDPTILKGVFDLARVGLSVALVDPIGLYLAPVTFDGLLDPDGNPTHDRCVRVVRASQDGQRILRLEIAPPADAGWTLDQCTLDGEPLRWGAQFARIMTVRLFGVAKTIPGKAMRKVASCLTFACAHPTRPLFKGTFSAGGTCDQVSATDWAQEAFDVPQVDTAGAPPSAANAPAGASVAVPKLQGRGKAVTVVFED